MEPFLIGLTTMSINKLASSLFDDLYKLSKYRMRVASARKNLDKIIPSLVQKMNNILMVKTLWQMDRAVNIESFYCDSFLITGRDSNTKHKRIIVNNIAELSTNQNYVIRGIAGQGKSIFLRHLFAKEIEAGNRFPIFIELRRIQQGESLLDHVTLFLDMLNISLDIDILKSVTRNSNFVFFLDGFDEISESQKPRLLNELEYLSTISSKCQFIISTRPNNSIEMSPLFELLTLDYYQDDEYKSVIYKLSDSDEFAKNLIRNIIAHKANVSELLCTPLLVTLLLISYKSSQDIPEKLSDFYESIFYVLLRRHDGTKPGFIRLRQCSINDNQYKQLFSAVCFYSKSHFPEHYNYTFDYDGIYKIVEKSMSFLDIKEDPDCYLRDILNLTCLILKEGDEYQFIHRSVQEYYTASFLKNRPEHIAKTFYSKCQNFEIWRYWQQELDFLSDIDSYRHHQYYLLPVCHEFLQANDEELISGLPDLSIERIQNIIGPVCFLFFKNKKGKNISAGIGIYIGPLLQIADISYFIDDFFKLEDKITLLLVQEKIKPDKKLAQKWMSRELSHNEYSVSVSQIINEGSMVDELTHISTKIFSNIYSTWKSSYELIQKENSLDVSSIL